MNTKLIKLKALILAIVLVFSVLLTTSCIYPGYSGDYPELCSVAWANLLSARGTGSNGEAIYDPDVKVLQKDSLGRVLFAYSEDRGAGVHLLIMQKSDENKAYYYPEDCYLFITNESNFPKFDLESEQIFALKAQNDWDLPINESKCESTEIVRKKQEGKLELSDSDREKIIKEFSSNPDKQLKPGSVSLYDNTGFITSDSYGRELHIVTTVFSEITDKSEKNYYYYSLIIIMPDGSLDVSTVIILSDMENPQDDVKKIKAENGWNTPIS